MKTEEILVLGALGFGALYLFKKPVEDTLNSVSGAVSDVLSPTSLIQNATDNISNPESNFRKNLEGTGEQINIEKAKDKIMDLNYIPGLGFLPGIVKGIGSATNGAIDWLQNRYTELNQVPVIQGNYDKPKSSSYYSMLPPPSPYLSPRTNNIVKEKQQTRLAKKTTAGSVGLTGEDIFKLTQKGKVDDKAIKTAYANKSNKSTSSIKNYSKLSSIAKANLAKAGYS